MKKAILLHRYLINKGGAERVVIDDNNILLELGYKSKILCLYRCKKNFSLENIDSVLNFNPRNKISKLYGNIKIILKIFISNPDYLITSSSPILGLFAKLVGAKIIYLDHHPITMSPLGSLRSYKKIREKINQYYPEADNFNLHKIGNNQDNFLTQIKLFFSYSTYKFYDRIIVLSSYSKKEKSFLLKKSAKISMPFLDKKFIKFNILKKGIQKKKYILSVSRLHENKNIMSIINGFKKSKLKEHGFKLIIVGDGPLKSKLNKLIKKSDNIEIKGKISDDLLFKLYEESFLFISLQYADFNLTAVEALLANCKLIVPNILYLGENNFINKENITYINNVNSTQEIAKKLIKISNLFSNETIHCNKKLELLYQYLINKERRVKELLY